jgi:hypothetical protein
MTTMQIISPSTATQLYNRLSDVERIRVRTATPGQLEHLAVTAFTADLPGVNSADATALLTEVQLKLKQRWTEVSEGPWWEGPAWKG